MRKITNCSQIAENKKSQIANSEEIENCAQFAICEKFCTEIIKCAAIANFRNRNRNLSKICENRKRIYIPAHRTQHDNDEEEEIKRVEEDYTRQSARPEFGLEEALEELSRHEDPQEEQSLQVAFLQSCFVFFSF